MFVIIYNTNGKLIMLFVIVMSIFIVLSFINNDMFAKSVSVAIVFVLIFGPTNIYSSTAIKPLYNAKLKVVIGLINIFQKNWLENVPQSSRVRIEEFRNVYIEFMKKPWIIITGKGYLGSIKDYTGYITNLNTYDGLCSEIEWTHKTFFNLHEITSYILTYGALGILFCINFLQTVIIHLVKENNIWILIGAYWFILFYGYSLTISTFSIAALLYGAWQVESINHTCRIYRYFNNLRLTSED